MGMKVFRIVSNSEKLLSADVVAEALLKQITLHSIKPNVFFAVREYAEKSSKGHRSK
jgi:hypothetical protein